MIELVELTEQDIEFLAQETGHSRQRLEFLRLAAQLTEETGVPAEAFYGWFRLGFPQELAQLLAIELERLQEGLEQAIEENIIPERLRESLDEILAGVAELQRELRAQVEATYLSHQVVGRLLNETTGAPMAGVTVRGFDLDANPAQELSYDISNGQGLFGLVYTTPPDGAPDENGRRLRLHILDRTGEDLHQTEQLFLNHDRVLDIPVPLSAGSEPSSPRLAELGPTIGMDLPAPLVQALGEHGIHTLADARRTGGLSLLEGLPVDPGHPAVQALEAHANLSILSSDLKLNTALIGQGYTSVAAIAQVARSDFVTSFHEQLGDYMAAELHVRAQAQSTLLDNALAGALVEQANGFKLPFDASLADNFSKLFPPQCSCEDCEAAVSPLAYLADLLEYTLAHVKDGKNKITLQFLHSTFHQRFGHLPAACAEMDKKVCQVRLCIEVLRSYLKAKNLPGTDRAKLLLDQAERKYRLDVYTMLLSKIGTSYEELRLARTADAKQRQVLAERLGIDLSASRPDELDMLFLDAKAAPPQLTEEELEKLFGLVDTTRDPLADGPTPHLQTWRLAHLRTLWHAQEWPVDLYSEGELPEELQDVPRPPVIDPDLIGPDDFRLPSGTANAGIPGQAFELWLQRRTWVDSRIQALSTLTMPASHKVEIKELPPEIQWPAALQGKVSYHTTHKLLIFTGEMSEDEKELLLNLSPNPAYQEAITMLFEQSQQPPGAVPDMAALFASMYEAVVYAGSNVVPWATTTAPEDCETLAEQLAEGANVEAARLQLRHDLCLTEESFARLLAIQAKDQLAHADPKSEPVTDEEWAELHSILVQAQKIRLFPIWRTEEQQLGVRMDPQTFWLSLREPIEGRWPPALPEDQTPTIDPDLAKPNDLPEGTAGRRALAIWQMRAWQLDQVVKKLKMVHKQAKANNLAPFEELLKQAVGHPDPGDPLEAGLDVDDLGQALGSADPQEVEKATADIQEKLCMAVDDFKRLLAIRAKPAPLAEEWAELYAILAKTQKVKHIYPLWLQEEGQAGLHTQYWQTRKACLPKWRAAADARAAWQRTLRGRSQAPLIDPHLIGPGDMQKPLPSNPAYTLWKDRGEAVNQIKDDLKAMREAAGQPLVGFDKIVVQAFFGPAALTSIKAELKTDRETNDLAYVITQAWGSPTPDLEALLADLQSSVDAVKAKARKTIATTLYLTVEAFDQFMAIRAKDKLGAPVTGVEWDAVEAILAQAVLVKSGMGLGDERDQGQDIEPRLDQFSLPIDAFSYLLRMRKLIASGGSLLASEWDEVYAILTQVQKRRKFGEWRNHEQAQKLLLGPDRFMIPTPPPLTFPPPEPEPLPAWLATWSNRQEWQDRLQTRIDQEQAVLDALREAVGAAEEATLPQLRDALVWASNSQGPTLEDRAKWCGDKLLIDAKTAGCQQTTRVAQAIETMQNLLFSLRARILNDTYPDLDLDADNFDEAWQWIGSYATWRAAMFVLLYPENILIPSLRRRQTPAFRTLVNTLRSNRRLTPQQARQAARGYADYFADICKLQLQASCQTRTRLYTRDESAADFSYLFYMFARGKATNTVYWSAYDPKDASGYAQSFWEAVPGLKDVINIIGALPYEIPGSERHIYLFARVRSRATQKLVFTRYDLEKRSWDDEPTELGLPEDAVEFTAVLKQSYREDKPPHLAIRLSHGAIYHRHLNRDGSDWEDKDWELLMGRAGGKRFQELCAMVEYTGEDPCLIVRTNGGELKYRLYGSLDDGWWQPLDFGSFLGAFCWPGTDHIYVFIGNGSASTYRIIKPKSLQPSGISHIDQLYEWLMNAAGADLHGIVVEEGLYAGLTFYQLLKIGIDDDPNLPRWSALAQPIIPILGKAFDNWYKWLRTAILDSGRWNALLWLTSKASEAEFIDEKFGAWKLAALYVSWFTSTWLPALLNENANKKGVTIQKRSTIGETSIAFAALQNLSRIVPISGVVPNVTEQQFAVQCNDTQNKVYRCTFLKPVDQLWFSSFAPVAPQVTGPYTIPDQLSEAKLQFRRSLIKDVYEANTSGPQSNLTYLEEAYHFVPVHLALQLQERGHYLAALDWFRSVYDYSMPKEERKIYYGLVKEESLKALYERAEDWLLDPLNPHEIAATRRNTYTRFTLLSIIRCLLEYADAEFTHDTPESVPRARLLYLTVLELLETAELKQQIGLCTNLIGNLDIQVGDPYWMPVFDALKQEIALITDTSMLTALIGEINAVMSNGEALEVQFAKASDLVAQAKATLPPPQQIAGIVEGNGAITAKAQAVMLADSAIAASAEHAGTLAAHNFQQAVSIVSGMSPEALAHEKAALSWLRQPMTNGAPLAKPATAILRQDYRELTRYNPLAPSHTAVIAQQAREAPLRALKLASNLFNPYVPAPVYKFCIPPNPVLESLRLRAELNLYKIRTCRNIAGMVRQLDPYAAPTDTFSGLPMIGAGGQLVLPSLNVIQPTPYRYPALIERAKQLVGLAQQIEAALLSAIEKGDAERYSILKARQDVRLAAAGVRLQTLRVKEAEGGVKLAELQQERAQLEANHYKKLLDEGPSENERFSLNLLRDAAKGFAAASLAAAIPNIIAGMASGTIIDYAGIHSGLAQAASATSTYFKALADYERQTQDWQFRQTIALQEVRIGAQQVKIAEDHVRVVGQERVIAEMQADHAREVVDFLSNKFTNVELYDWMSDILEGVYSFFLQQATSVAQLAASQLAFERQAPPPPFIQADYWEAPGDGMGTGTDGKSPDRRGLTGSARLLQDIYQLDQHAFDTNKRKLQLTKTISLAQLAPVEFQRFRETGVMMFATPMEMFDRDFPGHYLRLIHRVRTSVIALIPPVQGIRATLSTTGTSRVVIGGDIFQTVIRNAGPESVALTSPRDATGLFELEQHPEMLRPFEGLGVDTTWEFRMPKAANLFDYRTIADVLITIDYTALNSFDYYQQVIYALKPIMSADRPFSFRHQFADQWYDLHNPEMTETPMTVRFQIGRDDFPPNLEKLKIQHVTLYFARRHGQTFEVPVTYLRFTESSAPGPVGSGAITIDGIISTRKGNAGSWMAMLGKTPLGEWEMALPNTVEMKNRFKQGEIEDILFVITYGGHTPEWPV